MKDVLFKFIILYKKISILARELRLPFIVYTDCKFYPTCSDYAACSIDKYGPFKGSIKTFTRIIRCSPFSKGGIDLP